MKELQLNTKNERFYDLYNQMLPIPITFIKLKQSESIANE